MADLSSHNRICHRSNESDVVPGVYQHDRITEDDLRLLGIVDPTTSFSGDVGTDASSLMEAGRRGTASDLVRPVPVASVQVSENSDSDAWESESASRSLVRYGSPVERVEGHGPSDVSLALPLPDDEEEGRWGAVSDQSDFLWHTEVPEAPDALEGEPLGELSGVSSEERAIQLALAFLQQEDLVSCVHLDLLADIILERGWTSVQIQVRALVRTGYSVDQIHRMFQLTSLWLHCVESDTLAPDGWHAGQRLTWQQAARLLDFMGYDAELEQIADFLSVEQQIWSYVRRDAGQLATFKDYLFKYRLSIRTQVEEGIWQSNLDPADGRSFDGTRHDLYSSDWWDEPTGSCEPDFSRLLRAGYDLSQITEQLGLELGGYRRWAST